MEPSTPRLPGRRVGIVEVGPGAVCLLVVALANGVVPLRRERAALALDEEVERLGRVSPGALERAAELVRAFARAARDAGAERLEVLVGSPGRHASNGQALARALAVAAGAPARVLGADEEARLAFAGAVAAARPEREPVAVVSVGRGSTRLVVGTVAGGPAWLRSVDLGTRRLAARSVAGEEALTQARDEARAALASLVSPLPRTALAAGGSARALQRLTGARTLGPETLADAPRLLAGEHGLEPDRAGALTAAAVLLAEVQRRLAGVAFEVADAGVREGAALALLAEATAA